MTIEDELQAAADSGELGRKSTEAVRKQIEQTERRWIVMQVREIAIHQQLTPDQFKELCEFIRTFTELRPAP